MAEWLTQPPEPLYHQPDQVAMLEARRARICRACKLEFCIVKHGKCPQCKGKGVRKFSRLTIIAGRRFGKSKIGSIMGVEEASIPHSLGWACAPTVPKLHRYVIPAFQQLIPQEWVLHWDRELLDLRLKNGSLIHFQTLEHPDQGRGQGLDWLWIDEVCELTEMHWEVIRASLAGDKVAFFTTTPRGYDWVYEKLYKPAELKVPGYWACHAKSINSANPDLTEEFLAREATDMSPLMFQQEYEADFVNFTGAVYGELVTPQVLRTDADIRRHIPEWPFISPDRPTTVGIDTGADHPFGAVKLVSTEKGLVAVAEYLERDKSFWQHTQALKRLAGSSASTKFAINKNERQPMIEFAQHGINCHKAENDQHAGIERVKTWLHNRQLWIVESTCHKLVEQMKALRWADPPKDNTSRGVAKVYKKNDELADCLRYALMTYPSLMARDEASKKRDISQMDSLSQWQIQRQRRLDKDPDLEVVSAMEDFWS